MKHPGETAKSPHYQDPQGAPPHLKWKSAQRTRKVNLSITAEDYNRGLSELQPRVDDEDVPPIEYSRDNLELINWLAFSELSSSSTDSKEASLMMEWDLLRFMTSQFDDDDMATLGSVITLSGSVLCSQATTCSQYVQDTWPLYGAKIIKVFQLAIDHTDHKAKVIDANLDVSVELKRGACGLDIQSKNIQDIALILQQVIWMGAALRVSDNERIQYSSFNLENSRLADASEIGRFNVSFQVCEPSEAEQSCWVPLFANATIAGGFPVPERKNKEQGLEIPLEMMAALGGARHITTYEGGLVLKGFSAMFVPIKRCEGSIQWHFIRGSEESRMLYREIRSQCSNRALLPAVDHESLKNARTFLGWWKSAETHLGTADAAYDSIDWSPAAEARRSARFSGIEIGFQSIATGNLSFTMGAKDGRLHFSRRGPFQRIVQCAEKTPVALYDPQDRRAWLVPALDVMLHIVQTRHRICPYNIGGNDVEIASTDPRRHTRYTARDAVIENQPRKLYEDDSIEDKGFCFRDAIIDIWSQMERLKEKNDSMKASPGLALQGTMRIKLNGWEYMSLVEEKNYVQKETIIDKTSGGWVDLVDDIDTLVLFATGFGEIIKPVSNIKYFCRGWRSLPTEKDYLAACVPMVELLYAEAGSRISRKHLSTSHLQWHRGSSLFEPCKAPSASTCACDRTQQIYHDSLFKTFGHVRPPGQLEADGCVIFGQANHALKPTRNNAIRGNENHILLNAPLQDPEASPSTSSPREKMRSLLPMILR